MNALVMSTAIWMHAEWELHRLTGSPLHANLHVTAE